MIRKCIAFQKNAFHITVDDRICCITRILFQKYCRESFPKYSFPLSFNFFLLHMNLEALNSFEYLANWLWLFEFGVHLDNRMIIFL